MNFLNPTRSSRESLERREKLKNKGRKHYIFYTGILRWGMSVLALSTLWHWHDNYGWHTPPRSALSYELVYFAFSIVLWSVSGYFFGDAMWKKMGFENSTSAVPKS